MDSSSSVMDCVLKSSTRADLTQCSGEVVLLSVPSCPCDAEAIHEPRDKNSIDGDLSNVRPMRFKLLFTSISVVPDFHINGTYSPVSTGPVNFVVHTRGPGAAVFCKKKVHPCETVV